MSIFTCCFGFPDKNDEIAPQAPTRPNSPENGLVNGRKFTFDEFIKLEGRKSKESVNNVGKKELVN